ncbi:putative short chain dehydrogenase/oxidoreductase, partial [Aureobasidium melanogenum]
MDGKTALVTGGWGGLGLAISDALLTAGCNVVVCDINNDALQKFRETHSSVESNKILTLHCDISKQSEVTKLFEDAIERFGKVDFVINNAGVMDKMDPVGTLDMNTYNKVIAINLTAPIMISKVAVQHMMEKNVAGCIINIASVGGLRGFAAGTRTILDYANDYVHNVREAGLGEKPMRKIRDQNYTASIREMDKVLRIERAKQSESVGLLQGTLTLTAFSRALADGTRELPCLYITSNSQLAGIKETIKLTTAWLDKLEQDGWSPESAEPLPYTIPA